MLMLAQNSIKDWFGIMKMMEKDYNVINKGSADVKVVVSKLLK